MNDTKTKFERNLEWAQENNKIVYYDYISYKRAAGWWTGLRNDDWHRPTAIEKAKYNGEFLYNLSDYYFLGFPIKELLKHSYANGHCHACAIALSLYFKSFEIITCNLKNYAEHCTIESKNSFYGSQKLDEYEHTALLIDLDGKKTVIDTTFGFITDYETYQEIFNPNKIRIITSEQLKEVEPYQYIKALKDYKLDLKWFHYVKKDDELDERLDGVWKDTIERNKRVLENYHKEQIVEPKSKVKKLKLRILKH